MYVRSVGGGGEGVQLFFITTFDLNCSNNPARWLNG